MPAAPAAPTVVAGTATWPDHEPYQKVGRWHNTSGLGVIKMPVPLVAAIQRITPGDPSRWMFFDGFQDFAGHGWRIVQLYSGHGYLTLLVARGSWTILGAPASLSVLNECLDPLVPVDLRNREKTKSYLNHVVLLQKHGQAIFLDNDFRRQKRIRYKLWTDGTKAQQEELLALCHDPVTTQSGNDLILRLNVMPANGAVERWTFHLQLGKVVQLEGTTIRQVCKEGTFFYPLM